MLQHRQGIYFIHSAQNNSGPTDQPEWSIWLLVLSLARLISPVFILDMGLSFDDEEFSLYVFMSVCCSVHVRVREQFVLLPHGSRNQRAVTLGSMLLYLLSHLARP